MSCVGAGVVSVGLENGKPEDSEDDSEDEEDDRHHNDDQLGGLFHPHLSDSHFERRTWHTGS